MVIRLVSIAALVPMLLANCAPTEPPAPLPSPGQTTAQRRPPPRPPAATPRAEPRAQADAAVAERAAADSPTASRAVNDAPAAQAAPVEGATATAAAAPPAPAGYRVRADGVVGCADAQRLRLLAQLKATPGVGPRLLAQAHRDGRCMTAFTNRVWVMTEADGGLVRLRLSDQEGGTGSTPLWFLREDVVPLARP